MQIAQKTLDEEGYITWATNKKLVLFKYGFGYVWQNGGVQEVDWFIEVFKLRVKDCCLQEWHSDMLDNNKLESYVSYKFELEPERYVISNVEFKYKKAVAKLRTCNHSLRIETGRHDKTPQPERYCKWCYQKHGYKTIEDEKHFICVCSLYDNIRKTYLVTNVIFEQVMNQDVSVKNLSIYVYNAFRLRHQFIVQ